MGIFKPNVEKLKAKRDIKGLVNALYDEREQSTRTVLGTLVVNKTSDLAAQALIELGDRTAVTELIKVVGQAPETYQLGKSKARLSHAAEKALEILGRLGDSRAIPVLVQALSKHLRFAVLGVHPAARALGQIGDPAALLPLFDLLSSPDLGLRRNAIQALGQLHSREAVPTLVNLLDDPEICNAAIGALMEIGDDSVVPQLVEIGKKGSKSTRQSVFVALAKLGDEAGLALPMAVETLRADLKSGLRDIGQTCALRYLCGLDRPEVVPLILASLPALADAEFQWKAAMVIGGDVDISWSSPFKDCVQAISRLGDKDCIPQLEDIKHSLDELDYDIMDKVIADLKRR